MEARNQEFIQRPEHLDHLLLLVPGNNREQVQTYSSWDMNLCPHRILVLKAVALPTNYNDSSEMHFLNCR